MYAHFYHLSENPFNLTPDPKFHYVNESTREALASMMYGIKSRKGFLTLIGEAGTGKTTMLRRIVDEIEGETRVVFVFNPGVSFDELLEYICMELGIRTESRGRLHLLERLNKFLLEQLTEGVNVVVIIDEAQTLEDNVLEELRLLSNLETSKEKILQIVLSGQPELEEKLRRPNLRQLRQRIGVRATLKPMRADEIRAYVETRLRTAGGQKAELFTSAALMRCWQAAQGIPRVINVICDNAMMIAFAEGKDRITASLMNAAIRDLDGQTQAQAWASRAREFLGSPTVRYGALTAVVLIGAYVAGRVWSKMDDARPAPVEVASSSQTQPTPSPPVPAAPPAPALP
ncbi:MAG TPA: AAA family ATPase, partial [Burkholderiales bacterium]|nr:AAA family ATPase [Burkholderiales bacterium]